MNKISTIYNCPNSIKVQVKSRVVKSHVVV